MSEKAPEPGDKTKPTLFSHPSEEEFAKLLDFYQLKWLYEPHTFALEWDAQGKVSEAFTPDFYLPEQDLYIELTTLRQDLVTGKNRKLRRLRELYPQVNIKLFYRRDYRRLLEKYGLLEKKEATIGRPNASEEGPGRAK